MGDEYQRELFEEFGEKKGKFKRIADRITERQQKFYLRISLENIVFAVIIAVMCIIIAFAMGVERGKRALSGAAQQIPEQQKEVTLAPAAEETGVTAVGIMAAEPEKAAGTYTIQLISYKKKSLAEKEKRKLSDENIEAFVIRSGEWFQVCAGGYGDIKDAKAALRIFSKEYKGCFIRKREGEG